MKETGAIFDSLYFLLVTYVWEHLRKGRGVAGRLVQLHIKNEEGEGCKMIDG